MTVVGDDYYDLNDHCLHSEIKIVKRNGAGDVVATEKNGAINFFLHSVFSRNHIHINGQLVSVASNTYTAKSISKSNCTTMKPPKKRS